MRFWYALAQKMPTIQLYKKGVKVVEHIAAEGAIDALERVRPELWNYH